MKTIKEKLESRPLFTVKSGSSIQEAVNSMSEHNIGLLPVLADDGKLLGVFSERDLVRRVISKELDLNKTKVDEVLSTKLVIASINESYEECLQKMKVGGTRHILIIDNEKLVGILSIRDLLEIDIIVKKETIEVLHNYIYSA